MRPGPSGEYCDEQDTRLGQLPSAAATTMGGAGMHSIYRGALIMTDTPNDRRWLPLNALRAFEGVAKHGSFTAAANALLISQSALSRHVIALEKLLGQQLFERRPHALMLTKAGQYLLPAIMKSFDRLEYALDEVRNEGAPRLRTLRVQMPPSFAVQLAVPILRDFRRASVEVDIDLVSPYGVGPPLVRR